MTTTTRSLYAVDPGSQKVRLVVQVTPVGWADETELENAIGAVVSVLGEAGIRVALMIDPASTFVVHWNSKLAQFEVVEIGTSEAVAPFALDPDPSHLFPLVEAWLREVAGHWQVFVPTTLLPKCVPEIVGLIVGSELRSREGAIGLPDALFASRVLRLDS
jgi:hypothetical protein